MAFVYHAFFHVLTENGNKTLVDEPAWGAKRLTGDDLTRYVADMQTASVSLDSGIESGQIVVSDLEETTTLSSGQTVTVVVGQILTFPGATSKFQFHSKYYEWAEVMKQDPNLSYIVPVWADETP